MATDLQVLIFSGRLGGAPELSYAKSGKAYCKVSVACNEAEKDENGEWHDRADWFYIVAFDKTAEILGEYKKGQPIMVYGRMRSRKTEKGTFWEVRAQRIERLDRSRPGSKRLEESDDGDDFSNIDLSEQQ